MTGGRACAIDLIIAAKQSLREGWIQCLKLDTHMIMELCSTSTAKATLLAPC